MEAHCREKTERPENEIVVARAKRERVVESVVKKWNRTGPTRPGPPRPPLGPILSTSMGIVHFLTIFDRCQTYSPPLEIADLHATCQRLEVARFLLFS